MAPLGSGSGSALPPLVLALAGLATLVSTSISVTSIYLHLKNYRKPRLQRMVIRIMIMVPLYSLSSLISLFSLEAAFVIDAIRDIYEAFVIYCFFNLLLGYLGGERELLIMLQGREPRDAPFPFNLFRREIDPSDPYLFLFLKRGILQYVQVKPMLAFATLLLKAIGLYNEGSLKWSSGYLYISVVYNASICLSLYCLALFWVCISNDIKPFRPMPKFLCIKGILFFSFWQSILISILVVAGAIKSLGPYTDEEHISLGLTDMLICFEMPIFAVAHMFAFSHTDYIETDKIYAARMPVYYASRDSFGINDVVEDAKATLRGEGMDYREFEPAEGRLHQGAGRERRIKAGLRYSRGGRHKYWLPMPAETVQSRHDGDAPYAPLLEDQADQVVHDGSLSANASSQVQHVGYELPFGDIDEEDDKLFGHTRQYIFGDYLYPCVDVSTEQARRTIWDEEERVLRDERGAYFSPLRGPGRGSLTPRRTNYGTLSLPDQRVRQQSVGKDRTRPTTPATSTQQIDSDVRRPPISPAVISSKPNMSEASIAESVSSRGLPYSTQATLVVERGDDAIDILPEVLDTSLGASRVPDAVVGTPPAHLRTPVDNDDYQSNDNNPWA